jgi:hypothetical protein
MKTSTQTREYRRRPVCREATFALTIAVIALGLAMLGVYNPQGTLRFPLKERLKGVEAFLLYGGIFILPIGLGISAGLVGGHSFRTIERSTVKLSGDGFAFFSIMIGLFATIIGVCTTFAGLIWPML